MSSLPSLSYINPKDKAQILIDNLGTKFQKQHTLNIQNMDMERDSLYRSIYHICVGESYRFNLPERANAANILLSDVFGEKLSLVNFAMLSETSTLDEKLESLKSKYSTQVNALGLKDLVDDIYNINEDFKVEYKKRSSDKEDLPSSIGEMTKPLDRELQTICSYIISTYDGDLADSLLDPLFKVVKKPSSPK